MFARVACFNQCCRDLVQALTPYDVLRLRQGLGLSSGRFLGQYARTHTGPGSGLPVVTLKPADEQTQVCPFVTPTGCRVYPHRPASCRTYPLVRSLHRARATGAVVESFYILREPHCHGFAGTRERTVAGWIDDQGLCDYNAENDRMIELISAKNRLHPGPLAAEAIAALTRRCTIWMRFAPSSRTGGFLRPGHCWRHSPTRSRATTFSCCMRGSPGRGVFWSDERRPPEPAAETL
jgi:Fe-S-cluster containining protein